MKNTKRAPKPSYRIPTLADLLLAKGQRLRATEVATPKTFDLAFAAKWAQAHQGGAR